MAQFYSIVGEIGGHMAWHPPRNFRRHADGGTYLTGGAVAALKAVMLDEGLLQGMQVAWGPDPLNGRDRASLALYGK